MTMVEVAEGTWVRLDRVVAVRSITYPQSPDVPDQACVILEGGEVYVLASAAEVMAKLSDAANELAHQAALS